VDCCRAKERILAHGKEQHLDIPVAVTERGSVAVEDVACMLDTVLINSSNNADRLCELQDALAAARADASTLREDLAAWQSHHTSRASSDTHALEAARQEAQNLQQALAAALAETEHTRQQLASLQQAHVNKVAGSSHKHSIMKEGLIQLQKSLEAARHEAAAAKAELVTLQATHAAHMEVAAHAQEEMTQQMQSLQQSLTLAEGTADALQADLESQRHGRVSATDSAADAMQALQEAREEVQRLNVDIEQAEQREDKLLKQITELQVTVRELTDAMEQMQCLEV
jgi:chromosome segregation ATPase